MLVASARELERLTHSLVGNLIYQGTILDGTFMPYPLTGDYYFVGTDNEGRIRVIDNIGAGEQKGKKVVTYDGGTIKILGKTPLKAIDPESKDHRRYASLLETVSQNL